MKTMKSRLRTSFLLLIVIFLLASLLLFNAAMQIYIDRSAKRELDSVVQTVETSVQLPKNLSEITSGKLDSALLKLRTAKRASELDLNVDLFLYSRRHELLYPSGDALSVYSSNLTDKIAARLPLLEGNKVYTIRDGTDKYYILAYPLTSFSGQRPTIVFVETIAGAAAMLRSVNLILVIVILTGVGIAAWLSGRLAGRIARPVADLSALTRKIGGGEFIVPSAPKGTEETEELRVLYASIRDMAARLESADQSQKTFFQNASHELKTPLMSIQGYAEGIAKGVLPDVQNAAGVIVSESVRLGQLVDELLTLSRIESRTYPKDLIRLNLGDLLKEYAQRLGGLAARQGQILSLGLPDVPVYIRADEELLGRTVMNVASNCLRYAKTEVKIKLSITAQNAFIHISDDGPGINPKDLPHIFERFYKGKSGNFGLGLAIAKTAVEFMGGSIRVYNEKGAMFEITLPALPPLCQRGD